MYVSSLINEANIFDAYINKIRRLKKAFSKLRDKNIVSTQSSTNLKNIPSNSVDYIFIDPPFGQNLMYSELNFLIESWDRIITNTKHEVPAD